MYNNHDSLVAPLQPIALDAPISPARDFLIPTISELENMTTPDLSPRSVVGEDWSEELSNSNQPTPTWYHHEGDSMPDGLITDWTAEGVAGWVSSLGHGFTQYHDYFVEHGISGQELIHCNHELLNEIGVESVGHRLLILKNVYNVKIVHDIPIDYDDYVPVSADDENNKAATREDIHRLIEIVKKRDARIIEAESHIKTLHDTLNRLRNDLLPVWRMVKNKSQELPPVSVSGDLATRDLDSEPTPESPHPSANSSLLQPNNTTNNSVKGLSRKFSMKKLILGTPKNIAVSPTYPLPHDYQQDSMSTPTPSTSNGLTQAATSLPPPPGLTTENQVSPTSPASSTIHYPSYNPHLSIAAPATSQTRSLDSRSIRQARTPGTPDGNDDDREHDIFKKFRVSMDDPCRKVLPAALKRYNIQADWRQYALYIVHGDQERCLGLEERPLILFKQLDKEGRKPMFMLRKNTSSGGDAGGIQVPGGVL